MTRFYRADPLSNTVIEFPSKEAAVNYVERQGNEDLQKKKHAPLLAGAIHPTNNLSMLIYTRKNLTAGSKSAKSHQKLWNKLLTVCNKHVGIIRHVTRLC